jgi:hypothetical protein
MCIPMYATAARGAALRARDWMNYYDASYPPLWPDGVDEKAAAHYRWILRPV